MTEWGIIISILLAVLGGALIVGGIVLYRGSRNPAVRALAAGAVAAGVVMWAILLFLIPVSSTTSTP